MNEGSTIDNYCISVVVCLSAICSVSGLSAESALMMKWYSAALSFVVFVARGITDSCCCFALLDLFLVGV